MQAKTSVTLSLDEVTLRKLGDFYAGSLLEPSSPYIILEAESEDCHVAVYSKKDKEGKRKVVFQGKKAEYEASIFGYVKEDIFYAVLLHPAKVLDGPDGLQLVDSDGRRVEIESPSVLCGGKTLIVRGEAAGRELPDLVVTARDLARLACDNDGDS